MSSLETVIKHNARNRKLQENKSSKNKLHFHLTLDLMLISFWDLICRKFQISPDKIDTLFGLGQFCLLSIKTAVNFESLFFTQQCQDKAKIS